MTRIMAEDLYALLDANDVIPLPQRGDIRLDRAIEVEVGRFDATQAGEVTLDARWRIYGGDEQTLIDSGRSILTEASEPVPDYDAIVAAMSRVVDAAASRSPRRSAARRRSPALPRSAPGAPDNDARRVAAGPAAVWPPPPRRTRPTPDSARCSTSSSRRPTLSPPARSRSRSGGLRSTTPDPDSEALLARGSAAMGAGDCAQQGPRSTSW